MLSCPCPRAEIFAIQTLQRGKTGNDRCVMAGVDATVLNLVMVVGWPGLRAVHLAAWGGYADVVGYLLEAGAGREVVAGGESFFLPNVGVK